MSFAFKPFSKGNPCPVCDKADASCRYNPQEPDFILCHTYVDAHLGEKVNCYVCVKTSNGHTASFKPDNTEEWTEERKREWETKQEQRRQKAKQNEEQKRERALGSGDRHKFYSEILDELTLSPESLADLQRRGFTPEEIERSGFKSVKPRQKLSKRYPDNLPGIKENNLIAGDGYLQPIKDYQGQIVGMQVRLHNPEDGNKHRWLSSQENPVHTKEFGELPLAVFIPQRLQSFDIQIVEGTGAKPYLAAERRGMVTIGASGGNHTSSPETLKATITAAYGALQQIIQENGWTPVLPAPEQKNTKLRKSKESVEGVVKEADKEAIVTEPRPATVENSYLLTQLRQSLDLEKLESIKVKSVSVNIVPDAGFALNPSVIKSLLKTPNWLQENFKHIPICFSEWNQIHKSQGDIDELKDLSIVRTLKAGSFFKKYREVIDSEKGFANKSFQDWAVKRVKLTADIVQNEKWLSIPKLIYKECDILLIRKALGGGKTQALIEFLKAVGVDSPHIVSLLVGYRNTLLRNTINRAEKLGLNSMHIKDAIETVGKDVVNFSADDSIKLWGGCADSFFKFNAVINHNPEYFLIHDEICSVLGHLKGGGTLKGRQQEAIEWITNTIQNSKFALMMDANLSDKDVDFIRQLFPNKRIKVLDSVSPINSRKFYFLETEYTKDDYSRNPRYLPTQLVDVAKKHQRVLWLSDSQRSCEVVDEIFTESGHKHFRLDGKTSHDKTAESFQSDPVEFIKTEKLDSVSISPSGESGLSIDLYDYFDCVCFDIRGTVPVNTLTQLSARLRDTKVPIYVACPEFVNITSDPCPYAMRQVEEVLNKRIDKLLAQAMSADGELVDSQFVADMFDEMKAKFAKNPWFIESLKDAKDLKYEHSNLKLTLKTALAQAGHRVIDFVKGVDEDVYEEVQETKEKVKRREAEKTFNSEDITWEQAQELSLKDVDYETKCKISKARLKHNLPGIENTPSWNAELIYTILIDEPQILEKRWRLKQLENEELFKAVFKTEKKYGFEFGFTAPEMWKSSSTKIETLKMLGVAKIIEAGQFSSQDDWIQEIVNTYYSENSGYFELVGISKAKQVLNDDGSVKNLKHVKLMVDRFLDYFGLEATKSKTTNGDRSYAVKTPKIFDSYLNDIDDCLARRAATVKAEAETISLKAIADKAEEREREQREQEVKQRTHSQSGLGCNVPSSLYKTNENTAPYTSTDNIPGIKEEAWKQPETIAEVVEMLDFCEDAETLALIRRGSIPPEVFKVAARSLPHEKREQIRQWVTMQNAA